MADDSGQERTEAPTPKRRNDAREKGEVPRSQELTTAFLLIAGAVSIQATGAAAARDMAGMFRFIARRMEGFPQEPSGVVSVVGGLGWQALGAMAPMVLILSGTALVVTAVQARGILTVKPLQPQWNRINPISNAKRVWGVQALAQFAKSLLKILIIGLVIYLVLKDAGSDLPLLAQQGPHALLGLFQEYAVTILASTGAAYLILAMADYAFQIWQHERQLKMSKEEIRKEQKDTEGDQVMKVRRRTMGRQMARRRMLLAVSEADVVVTNPTHIAVALQYDPERGPAPVVLAMGVRKTALRIREIAKENGVPLVENKPLARALWATAKIGLPIPIELYVAVAEVLAFVFKNRRRSAWSGSEVV